MSARKTKRKRKATRTKKQMLFANRILLNKDMVRMILSFLCMNELNPLIRFEEAVYNASSFIREGSVTVGLNGTFSFNGIKFTVLPVSLKRINKTFNECVNELSHLIVAKQRSINIQKISLSSNCRNLKQLYLIESLYMLSETEINSKTEALNHFNFPCLEILQVHYYGHYDNHVDINLSMENLPSLQTLILGVLYDNRFQSMSINQINIDLDITELRIHYCNIKNLNSLRYSLARCSMIDIFYLSMYSYQKRRDLLHSLCLLSARTVFIQTNHLKEISIYAPNLEIIQFHECDILNKLIILDRLPPSLKSYVTPLTETNVENRNEYDMDIDTDTDQEIVEFDQNQMGLLDIGINGSLRSFLSTHFEGFTVLRNAKKYNENCDITYTFHERDMLVWPFAYFNR